MEVLRCYARDRDFETTGRRMAIIQCVMEMGNRNPHPHPDLESEATEFAEKFLTNAAFRARCQSGGGVEYAEGEIAAKAMKRFGMYQQQNARMLKMALERRDSAFKKLEGLLKGARRKAR